MIEEERPTSASKLVMDEEEWIDCDTDSDNNIQSDLDFLKQKRRRLSHQTRVLCRGATTTIRRRRRTKKRRGSRAVETTSSKSAVRSGSSTTTAVDDDVRHDDALVAQLQQSAKIEASAHKLGLNRIQVKTLIRRLVSSPLLLKIIMAKAGDCKEDEGNDEDNDESLDQLTKSIQPRMTRKRVKNAKEDGARLDWILDKLCRAECESPELLSADLPEDDDPADKEYEPGNEEIATTDEEYASDMDNSTNNSFDLRSPIDKATRDFSPGVASCPSSGGKSQSPDKFKSPAIPPIQPRPKSNHNVAKSLNFDKEVEGPLSRTRSKVNYKSVPIEELETSFEPPDVTPDMYITTDEHYAQFLRDTFYYSQQTEEQEETTRREIDFDPDYFYQESEELSDLKDKEEFIYNRSARIPRKEADDILNEVIEVYDLHHSLDNKKSPEKLPSGDKNEAPSSNKGATEWDNSTTGSNVKENYVDKIVMSETQLDILKHQIQQHVQLLTQSIIFSSSQKEESVNRQLRDMNKELYAYLHPHVNYSSNAETPKLLQQVINLVPSSDLIQRYDNGAVSHVLVPRGVSSSHVGRFDLTDEFLSFTCTSRNVFIYPSLLPSSGQTPDLKGVIWTSGEDELLALGMQDAIKDKNRGRVERMCESIAKKLISCKSFSQIHKRIKNARRRLKQDMSHPVVYFHNHGRAPPIARHVPEVVLEADVCLNEADIGLNEPLCRALPETYKNFLLKTAETENVKKGSKQKTHHMGCERVVEAIFDLNAAQPTLKIMGNPKVDFELPQALLQAVESTQQTGTQMPYNSMGQGILIHEETKNPEGNLAGDGSAEPVTLETVTGEPVSKKRKVERRDEVVSKELVQVTATLNDRLERPDQSKLRQTKEQQIVHPQDQEGEPPHGQAPSHSCQLPQQPQRQRQSHNSQRSEEQSIPQEQTQQQGGKVEHRVQLAKPTQGQELHQLQLTVPVSSYKLNQHHHCVVEKLQQIDRTHPQTKEQPAVAISQPTQQAPSERDRERKEDQLQRQLDSPQQPKNPSYQHKGPVHNPRQNLNKSQSLSSPSTTSKSNKEKSKGGQLEEDDAEYLLTIAKKLLEGEKFNTFLNLLAGVQKPLEMYRALDELCAPHTELQELLLDLLDSDTALELGPQVYRAFNDRLEQKRFFMLLRNTLEHQRLTEVLEAIAQTMGREKGPNLKELQDFGLTHFGDKPQVHNAFSQLLNQIDSYSRLVDHRSEHLEWKSISEDSLNKKVSSRTEQHPMKLNHSSEQMTMTFDGERHRKGNNSSSSSSGGNRCKDDCGCRCHSHEDSGQKQGQTLSFVPLQCVHCAISFINGKVFIRDDKNNLRPATVKFQSGPSS